MFFAGRSSPRWVSSALAFAGLATAVLAGLATVKPSSDSTSARAVAPGATAASAAPSSTPTPIVRDVPGLAAGVVAPARTRAQLRAASATLPTGNLPGWRQVFTEDFSQDVPLGGWAKSSYTSRWNAYDGIPDTHKVGRYDEDVLSVSDGHLDSALQTIDGVPRVTGLVPNTGSEYHGQLYGRYSFRFRADPVSGYAPAFLLWPDSNVWNEGEVDIIEAALDGYLNSFNHCPGHAEDACDIATTAQVWPDWHVATLEWRPTSLTVVLDGVTILVSTHVPQHQMHLVFQQLARPGVSPTASAHVQLDWVAIWAYDPTSDPATAMSGPTTAMSAS